MLTLDLILQIMNYKDHYLNEKAISKLSGKMTECVGLRAKANCYLVEVGSEIHKKRQKTQKSV